MRPSSPRSLLLYAKTPAFLVTNPMNIRYLTGVELSSGALLITLRRMTLFTDARYREEAGGADSGIRVRDLDALTTALRAVPSCGFEGDIVTVAQRDRWKKKFRGTRFLSTEGVLMHFRRSKDKEELRSFRRAQRITWDLLKAVPAWLRHGVTERELAHLLLTHARESGAEELSFDPIVAFGSHTSHPHHHPTTRGFKKGDIVQIDVGARVEGYCADQSRVFFTGKVTAEQERSLTAVAEAKEKAENKVRSGASTHELDRLARSVLRHYGMEEAFGHSLGHGVGLEIHEGVTLSQKRPDEKLLKSEIITIEPGVYFPGKFGIRLEDEVIVE